MFKEVGRLERKREKIYINSLVQWLAFLTINLWTCIRVPAQAVSVQPSQLFILLLGWSMVNKGAPWEDEL